MNTHQECWDAALIKTWRTNSKLIHAFSLYKALTGTSALDDPTLLRVPDKRINWEVSVRFFMAAYLEKISLRLWDQPPEKDIPLLRKLQTSTYSCSKSNTNVDKERNKARLDEKKAAEVMRLNYHSYKNRNQATDWNVVKGAARTRIAR